MIFATYQTSMKDLRMKFKKAFYKLLLVCF